MLHGLDGVQLSAKGIPIREPLMRVRPWLLRKPYDNERPNVCFIGLRGQGKTLRAVREAIRYLRKGVKVYANIDIVDAETGLSSIRINGWDDVVSPDGTTFLEDAIIFIDEAPMWVDATEWQRTPGEIKRYFRQSRKHGTGFILTAQLWTDVYNGLRNLLDWVVICEKVGWLPRRVPLYRYQVALPYEFDQIDGFQSKGLDATFKWIPDVVFASYDTFEQVDKQEWKDYIARRDAYRAEAAG